MRRLVVQTSPLFTCGSVSHLKESHYTFAFESIKNQRFLRRNILV